MSDDTLCAEYVIGLLPDGERRQFEKRLQSDSALRRVEAMWMAHFASFDSVHPPLPAPAVFGAIERRLFGQQDTTPNRRAALRPAVVLAILAVIAVILAKGYLASLIMGF